MERSGSTGYLQLDLWRAPHRRFPTVPLRIYFAHGGQREFPSFPCRTPQWGSLLRQVPLVCSILSTMTSSGKHRKDVLELPARKAKVDRSQLFVRTCRQHVFSRAVFPRFFAKLLLPGDSQRWAYNPRLGQEWRRSSKSHRQPEPGVDNIVHILVVVVVVVVVVGTIWIHGR